MADYQCHPLWEVDPGVYGDISPDSLPLPTSLREELNAWAQQYDSTLDINDPSNAGFESQKAADSFIATGYSLLTRLRQELGSDYQVTAFFKANPKRGAT